MKRLWKRMAAGVLIPAVVFCGMPLAGLFAWAEEDALPAVPDGSGDVVLNAQRMAKTAMEEDAEFEGFLFRLEEDAEIPASQDLPDGVEDVPFADSTYAADSLEQILDFVSEEDIEYIEPNYTVYLQDADGVPEPETDDPLYLSGAQWHPDAVRAGSAWELGLEGQDRDASVDMDHDGDAGNDDIIAAVIDSGINPVHEDFAADTILEGKSFLSETDEVTDALGHGTQIAGIIAAARNNARGTAGISDHVKILPLRVFNRAGTSLSTIVSAIHYVAAEKKSFDESGGKTGLNICVINMSLGFSSSSSELKNAVNQAIDAGIIVICSAGNAGTTAPNYPAQYAIGIGATDQDGAAASFSQKLSAENGEGYENKLWAAAPGKNIRGPYYAGPASYMTDSGTSFAAPQAAALAAVCKSIDNNLTHSEFRQILKETAVSASGSSGSIDGQDVEYGWGTIDFGKTIDYMLSKKSGTSKVTVSVSNENGTVLTGGSARLFAVKADGSAGTELRPDSTGKFSLSVGKKYIYRASAGGYEEQEGHVLLLNKDSKLNIMLRSRVYPTRFIVQNALGGYMADAEIVLKKNGKKIVDPSVSGTYPTDDGKYDYTVRAAGLPEASGSFLLDNPAEEQLDNGVHVEYVTLNGYYSIEPTCTEEGEAVAEGTTFGVPAFGHAFDEDGVCTRCGEKQQIPAGDPTIVIRGKKVSKTELKRLGETANLFYWPDGTSYYDRRVEGIWLKDLAAKYADSTRCVGRITVRDSSGTAKIYPFDWFTDTMLAWNIDGQELPSEAPANGFRMAVNDGNDGHWMEAPAEISFSYRSKPEGSDTSHIYGDPFTVPATCGADGYTGKICENCGHELRSDVVPATGSHSWDEGHELYDGNGKETGSTIFFCTVCGKTRIEQHEIQVETVPMYRMYNPNSGEHFYTGSQEERDNLIHEGWNYEGIAWNAPVTSSKPVYRLYNAHAGDHHYTLSAQERDDLVQAGWRYEGVCWNSCEEGGEPLYRLYNPNAYITGGSGAHHYTRSEEERDYLISLGWRDEKIAWYGEAPQ